MAPASEQRSHLEQRLRDERAHALRRTGQPIAFERLDLILWARACENVA